MAQKINRLLTDCARFGTFVIALDIEIASFLFTIDTIVIIHLRFCAAEVVFASDFYGRNRGGIKGK